MPKSSGQTTKTAAEAWAIEYLKSGQIVLKERISFQTFATDFFAPDSAYVRSRKLRGHTLGQSHLSNQQSYLRNYLLPEFGNLSLNRISSEHIELFTQDLLESGLSTSSVNHILTALKIILQEAYKRRYIPQVPVVPLVAQRHRTRGVLSLEEVRAFFEGFPRQDPRLYAIHLLAATTGMRMGEIRGLQRKSVHPDYVEVRTSWEKDRGLKETKTGRCRIVPIPERTQEALQAVLECSPYREPDDLVFFGRFRTGPLDHKVIEKNLKERLAAIGISEQERVRRGLCFHSWRHFFNSLLVNHRIPTLKIQSIVGHATNRMTENYYHPDEYRDVLEISRRIL